MISTKGVQFPVKMHLACQTRSGLLSEKWKFPTKKNVKTECLCGLKNRLGHTCIYNTLVKT
jgi:hypothetical protein